MSAQPQPIMPISCPVCGRLLVIVLPPVRSVLSQDPRSFQGNRIATVLRYNSRRIICRRKCCGRRLTIGVTVDRPRYLPDAEGDIESRQHQSFIEVILVF